MRVFSKEIEAKTRRRIDAMLFVDVRKVSGPSPDPSLLVLAAFQCYLVFLMTENRDADYSKIFSVC